MQRSKVSSVIVDITLLLHKCAQPNEEGNKHRTVNSNSLCLIKLYSSESLELLHYITRYVKWWTKLAILEQNKPTSSQQHQLSAHTGTVTTITAQRSPNQTLFAVSFHLAIHCKYMSISWCMMPHRNTVGFVKERQVIWRLCLSLHPSSTSRVGSQLRWCLSIYTEFLPYHSILYMPTCQHLNLHFRVPESFISVLPSVSTHEKT